jgi:hypothetical protein
MTTLAYFTIIVSILLNHFILTFRDVLVCAFLNMKMYTSQVTEEGGHF